MLIPKEYVIKCINESWFNEDVNSIEEFEEIFIGLIKEEYNNIISVSFMNNKNDFIVFFEDDREMKSNIKVKKSEIVEKLIKKDVK